MSRSAMQGSARVQRSHARALNCRRMSESRCSDRSPHNHRSAVAQRERDRHFECIGSVVVAAGGKRPQLLEECRVTTPEMSSSRCRPRLQPLDAGDLASATMDQLERMIGPLLFSGEFKLASQQI